jgi:hypothetical protein
MRDNFQRSIIVSHFPYIYPANLVASDYFHSAFLVVQRQAIDNGAQRQLEGNCCSLDSPGDRVRDYVAKRN